MRRDDLILFFDVNGTIIASDQAQNKSAEAKILQQLAKKYRNQDDHLLFHPKETLRHYALRRVQENAEAYSHYQTSGKLQSYRYLLDYLQEYNHPLYPEIKLNYQELISAFNAQHGMIFHSFYRLVHWLRDQQIPFSIVLRSFGHDIPAVMTELAQHNIFIEDHGHFRGHALELDGTLLKDPQAIMNSLKRGTHAAWRDDYTFWHGHHQSRWYGKLFFIDEIWPKTLFFDDNVIENEIIVPVNAQGDLLQTHDDLLNQGRIVAVNTLDALKDPDYFLAIVRNFLESEIKKPS